MSWSFPAAFPFTEGLQGSSLHVLINHLLIHLPISPSSPPAAGWGHAHMAHFAIQVLLRNCRTFPSLDIPTPCSSLKQRHSRGGGIKSPHLCFAVKLTGFSPGVGVVSALLGPGFPWSLGYLTPRKAVREPHACGYSWGCSLRAGELERIFPA